MVMICAQLQKAVRPLPSYMVKVGVPLEVKQKEGACEWVDNSSALVRL